MKSSQFTQEWRDNIEQICVDLSEETHLYLGSSIHIYHIHNSNGSIGRHKYFSHIEPRRSMEHSLDYFLEKFPSVDVPIPDNLKWPLSNVLNSMQNVSTNQFEIGSFIDMYSRYSMIPRTLLRDLYDIQLACKGSSFQNIQLLPTTLAQWVFLYTENRDVHIEDEAFLNFIKEWMRPLTVLQNTIYLTQKPRTENRQPLLKIQLADTDEELEMIRAVLLSTGTYTSHVGSIENIDNALESSLVRFEQEVDEW